MARKADPDFAVDSDRGSGTTAAKQAQVMGIDVFTERAATRAGLRDLDARMEAMPGLTRAQRDRERIAPRAQVAELGHPVMLRTLPGVGQGRVALSSRQKKARSKTRLAVQDALPNTQYAAQRDLVTNAGRFTAVGDALSDHAGDLGELSAFQAAQVRAVDRSIAAYERGNDRGHVLYANVEMPVSINESNLAAFIDKRLPAGTVVAFDRYTVATHQLHEATARAREVFGADVGEIPVFEIATRRGAYLGHSDSLDDTGHLLPRAMAFRVVGSHQAGFTAPDGTSGTRTVIQLRDITPEPAKRAPRRGRTR